jgi:hypothetical protein
LKQAHRRLISPAYMDGGMGDGGGCHPRDNIALSWLARKLDLSLRPVRGGDGCRERQAEWLADLMREHDLPKVILGTAYKPGSRIETGSPALLVRELLGYAIEVQTYDPIAERQPIHDELPTSFDFPAVFLIGCRHPQFPGYRFPAGSVVIDPFRYIPDQEGVHVIRVGAASQRQAGPKGRKPASSGCVKPPKRSRHRDRLRGRRRPRVAGRDSSSRWSTSCSTRTTYRGCSRAWNDCSSGMYGRAGGLRRRRPRMV